MLTCHIIYFLRKEFKQIFVSYWNVEDKICLRQKYLLYTENTDCNGCGSSGCPDNDVCENKRCSIEKELTHCYKCEENCKKGLLGKIKPYAFTLFAKKYEEEKLLDCLERNEKNGVVYHRDGINGDYNNFDDVEQLMNFILTGAR